MAEDDLLYVSDEEIAALVKELNSRAEVKPVPLILFFDSDTGSIKSISNHTTEIDAPYIEIFDNDLKTKLQDQSTFHKYKVVYDPEQKKNILVEIDLDFDQVTKIEDLILKFPTVETDASQDILIIQDVTKNCWTIKLSEELVSEFKNKPLNFDYYNLFITDFNDPNILHRTISVPFKKLVDDGVFVVGFDNLNEKKRLSVFSRKYFKQHGHIIKNEN